VIYAFGVAAALCLGLGFVLQQHAAQTAPPKDFLRFRLLLDLIRKPIWLAGIAAMVAGQVLSATALAKADVSLVEPMLTANLLFALAIARWLYRNPFSYREWGGALLLILGVTTFMLAGDPRNGNPASDSLPRWAVALAFTALCFVCVRAARQHEGALRAMLLATGAGLLFGLQDALTRRAANAIHGSLANLFVHWAPYAVLAVGIVALLLAQSAFEAGTLRASLPAITAAEPVAGIVIGVVVFQEHLRIEPIYIALEVIALLIMVAGVLLVGTSNTFHVLGNRHAPHRPHPPARPAPIAHRSRPLETATARAALSARQRFSVRAR